MLPLPVQSTVGYYILVTVNDLYMLDAHVEIYVKYILFMDVYCCIERVNTVKTWE